MRNIFLEKPYTKCDGETSPRLFSKKLKLNISLINKVLYSVILLNGNLRTIEYIKTKLETTCYHLILGLFKN